jgi:D-alanyl-D-alanine carboxypeptidase
VANPWNEIPADYAPDLVPLSTSISVEGSQVDRSCYDALIAMINDCNQACPKVCVVSSYRTQEYQTNSYNRKVQSYIDQGYSRADAEKEAATIIAKPGTSEHQLGLAVDIIDTRIWELVEEQATLPAQQWLMENSWKYGFILRYPKGKMDQTGIIYEPWHYRYVGLEVAKELHDSGLTLEEYLKQLS